MERRKSLRELISRARVRGSVSSRLTSGRGKWLSLARTAPMGRGGVTKNCATMCNMVSEKLTGNGSGNGVKNDSAS
jgi:hypothetical protein